MNSWIFHEDGKPTLIWPHPLQNGHLTDTAVAQHVMKIVKKAGYNCYETWITIPSRTYLVLFSLHCGSDNLTVVQSADALKPSIINNQEPCFQHSTSHYEDDGIILLNDLCSFLRSLDASPSKCSTRNGRKTIYNILESFMLWRRYCKIYYCCTC